MEFVLPMFYNALFRLLSFMLVAAFSPLEKLYEKCIPECFFEEFWVTPTPVQAVSWVEGGQPRHKHIYEGDTRVAKNTGIESGSSKGYRRNSLVLKKAACGTATPPSSQQEENALLFARRSVWVIEQAEATITRLLTPLICVQLSVNCTVSVAIMMFMSTGSSQNLFFYVTYVCLEMMQAYLVLDAPDDYRKKVSERISLG